MEKPKCPKNKFRVHGIIAILIVALLAFSSCLLACQPDALPEQPDVPEPPAQQLDDQIVRLYRSNSVEVVGVGDYGRLNSGTGLIIFGDDEGIIIATSLHVSGTESGLIWVKFQGENDYVNSNNIEGSNLIQILAYDQTWDLCIFRVDYQPTKMYNDLTIPFSGLQEESTDAASLQYTSRATNSFVVEQRQRNASKTSLQQGITPFYSHQATIGQKIYSYGNAGGNGIIMLEGQVVALEQQITTAYATLPLTKTTLPITEGCSGGAMFDESGRFLGLTAYGGGDWGEEYSFSIPAAQVYSLFQSTQN